MLDLLFVYGTLRSEFDNPFARMLRRNAVLVGRATVPGSIYRVSDYPRFRPEPAGVVHGELYRLSQPETTLQALDDYEGSEYERMILNDAWIYKYKDALPESTRIASGDFCAP